MLLKDISFPTLEENVFFDEVLFQLAEKQGGDECLRFWESPTYGVVLGRIGKEEDDVLAAHTAADGIPVLRRTSGGGTVVQGPGCLNFTFVLSKSRPAINDLRASYAWISSQVIEALKTLGVEAAFHPISDLAVASNAKKFSGNAQRRGKTHILHHGTILYAFDLDLITRYLKYPKDVPEYRKSRSHKDFVTNINIPPEPFKQCLARVCGAPAHPQPLTEQEKSLLKNYLK